MIKEHLPKGFAWLVPIGGYFSKLIAGVEVELNRIKTFLRGVVIESNPGTAVATQEEWYQQYGIKFNSTMSLKDRQATTLERYTSIGGQDIEYIQDSIDKAGFGDIVIFENAPPTGDASNECGIAECGVAECWAPNPLAGDDWIFYYNVTGTVDTDADTDTVAAILQRIAPGHCIPLFDLSVTDNVCGPAECNEAFCDG